MCRGVSIDKSDCEVSLTDKEGIVFMRGSIEDGRIRLQCKIATPQSTSEGTFTVWRLPGQVVVWHQWMTGTSLKLTCRSDWLFVCCLFVCLSARLLAWLRACLIIRLYVCSNACMQARLKLMHRSYLRLDAFSREGLARLIPNNSWDVGRCKWQRRGAELCMTLLRLIDARELILHWVR
jgi:hypothetical protein